MAKSKASQSNTKTTFGKRKKGKAQKSNGPKDKPTKSYKGQGR